MFRNNDKKTYIEPLSEIHPFYTLTALCESGSGDNVGGGGDPEELGRSPHRSTDMESIQPSDNNVQKILRDGQILILRDGQTYNLLGGRINKL